MKEDSSNTHSGTFRIRYIKNAESIKNSSPKAVPPNFAEIKKDCIRIAIGLVTLALVLTVIVLINRAISAPMSPEQRAEREADRAEKKAVKEVAEQKKKATKALVELYDMRQKKIKRAFSSKDGSHLKIVDMVKSVLDDPDSFRHYETKYWNFGKGVVYIAMEYGAKNKFGAMIRYSIEVIWHVDSDTFDPQASYEGKIRERRW